MTSSVRSSGPDSYHQHQGENATITDNGGYLQEREHSPVLELSQMATLELINVQLTAGLVCGEV